MLLSMTGHGAASRGRERMLVSVELRTINSRYLKVSVRTPEGYTALEPLIEESVRGCLRRGTVQVQLQVQRESTADDFHIDGVVLDSYRQQLQALGCSAQVDSLLALPGVVVERLATDRDVTSDWPLVEETVQEALARLADMRTREGQAMAGDLRENQEAIRAQLQQIGELAPGVAKTYQARLTERLNKLLSEHGVQVQPADVIREVGVFAERTDISEEMVRLRSHLDQFDSFIQSPESNGRKLDFLVQEMFREVNTIGSKANDAEIARHVVEIKSCIERMREMIQNIE